MMPKRFIAFVAIMFVSYWLNWEMIERIGSSALLNNGTPQESYWYTNSTITTPTSNISEHLEHQQDVPPSNDNSSELLLYRPTQTIIRRFPDEDTKAEAEADDPPYNNFRLEFLHIPKNAGTTIENIGLSHNLTWGACHFEFPWKRHRRNVLKFCPPLNVSKNVLPSSNICYWHYSLSQLAEKGFGVDPYDSAPPSLTTPQETLLKPKRFFAVLRNPFTRYVSLFSRVADKAADSASALNDLIQNALDQPLIYHDGKGNAYPTCQYQYILHDPSPARSSDERNGSAVTMTGKHNYNQSRMVHHVLRFENITEEFNELMERYELHPRLTSHTKSNVNSKSSVSVQDLTNKTVAKIVSVCAKDFSLLGSNGYSREPPY
jgi:hypothetical protein